MYLESIQSYHFRNLVQTRHDTDHRHVILVGNNGQGKSNFLEAVYMICYGSSFRSHLYKHIITFGEKQMSLIAEVSNEKAGRHTIKFIIEDGKRRIYLDNNEIKDRKELFDICACIIFSHEDIDFVKGSPSEQRRFFDQTISLIDPLYIDDLRSYTAAVRQRNAALRSGETELLSVYDTKIARSGLRLQQSRKKATDECNEIFPSLFAYISDDGITPSIRYRPSWRDAETLEDVLKILKEHEERDLRYEVTTTGPHRDRYSVICDNRDFTATASTGQMRLTALVLRSVQGLLYVKNRGRKPILLLDDVLLELDIGKRERFLSSLSDYDQAFFTFLPDESYFKAGSYDNITYRLEKGSCIRE